MNLDHVSLDGTKIKAHASRHKAVSYGYMKQEETRLRKEIRKLLRTAENKDPEEDERYGADRRGDEPLEHLARRKTHLNRTAGAKKALEAEAKTAAEAQWHRREEEERKCNGRPCSSFHGLTIYRPFANSDKAVECTQCNPVTGLPGASWWVVPLERTTEEDEHGE